MNLDGSYDCIIIGLGAMGSAAAYQMAQRGADVLAIDQLDPPHTRGSSHGDTRITRLAIGEGAHYTPLVVRSHEIWRAIENETGRRILVTTGGLILSSSAKTSFMHVSNFFENTLKAAEQHQIAHEILTAGQIRARFPQFNLRDDEVGYFEKEAGFVRPEEAITAQLELARKHGAKVRTFEKVLHFQAAAGNVIVTTTKGVYAAATLVLSAGPWLPRLIGHDLGRHFQVYRQVLYWFDTKGPTSAYLPGNFPIFIWELQGKDQGIYGFPALDASSGVKVATEQFVTATTPDQVDRHVSQEEIEAMYNNFVRPYLPGLAERCIKSVACLYTVTPDFGFVIDQHPDFENVIIASPCSGHGFKHSAAVGELLAQLVLDGRSAFDIRPFSLAKFG